MREDGKYWVRPPSKFVTVWKFDRRFSCRTRVIQRCSVAIADTSRKRPRCRVHSFWFVRISISFLDGGKLYAGTKEAAEGELAAAPRFAFITLTQWSDTEFRAIALWI